MASETAAPQEEAPAAETRPEDKRSVSSSTFVVVLEKLGRWTVALLARPRIRTVVVGVILILIGAFAVGNSFWTFPIVIVGIIMVIVAWVGSRLEGRFAIEWSEEGAGFEMRARFKAADTELQHQPLPAASGPAGSATSSTVTVTPEVPEAETVTEGPETIEGEAHTVEIDAEELRTLVAAAEKLARESTTTHNGTPVSWQGTRAA